MINDFMDGAQKMWRRRDEPRSAQTEDRVFREYFGIGPLVAVILWELLILHRLLLDGCGIIHLLWTLIFLKEYGKTHQMSNQAQVDANTFRKYVWLFIAAISELEVHVVRFFGLFLYSFLLFLYHS